MPYRFFHVLFSGVFLLCGAALFAHTFDSRYAAMGGAVSSLFYPRILFLIWSAAAAIMTFRALTKREEGQDKPLPPLRVFLAAGCIGMFLLLFFTIGFILASVVFFVALALLVGERAYVRLAIVAVAYSVGIYYLFNNVLQISLPVFGA